MLAYPPGSPEGQAAVRDRRALDRFVVNLKKGELRVKVLEGKPRSLHQAVNIAEEYTAIMDPHGDGAGQSAGLSAFPVLDEPTCHPGFAPQDRSAQPAPDRSANRNRSGARQGWGRGGGEARRRDKAHQGRQEPRDEGKPAGEPPSGATGGRIRKCDATCYRCQKKGHFARECGENLPGGGEVNCVEGTCCAGAIHSCTCATCHFPVTSEEEGTASASPNA